MQRKSEAKLESVTAGKVAKGRKLKHEAKELTDIAVKRLKPADKPYFAWDRMTTGLALKVTPAGRKIWVLQLKYPGERLQTKRTLGHYPALPLAEARKKAAEWYGLVRQGIDPADLERRQREAQEQARANTFGKFAESFIAKRTNRRAELDAREIRRTLIAAWKDRPLASITPRDVRQLIGKLSKRVPWEARNAWGHANLIFKHAVHEELIEVSPMASLDKELTLGVKFRPRDRVLNDLEVRALWHASHDLPWPHGHLYRWLLLTGVRMSEATGAEWIEFHPEVRRVLHEREAQNEPDVAANFAATFDWSDLRERERHHDVDAKLASTFDWSDLQPEVRRVLRDLVRAHVQGGSDPYEGKTWRKICAKFSIETANLADSNEGDAKRQNDAKHWSDLRENKHQVVACSQPEVRRVLRESKRQVDALKAESKQLRHVDANFAPTLADSNDAHTDKRRRAPGVAFSWSSLPAEHRTWTIPPERFKSDAAHTVPLTDQMLDLLASVPAAPPARYVFSTTGKNKLWSSSKVKRDLDRRMLALLREWTGDETLILPRWTAHDLRRTVRTNLSALGIADHVAEMVLGHGKRGLQRIYDQYKYGPQIRDALTCWNQRVMELVKR